MSETISSTFTFGKDGVFYFSRRIAKELRRHNTSPRIACSLRTRASNIADARARKAADQLDDFWFQPMPPDPRLHSQTALAHNAKGP